MIFTMIQSAAAGGYNARAQYFFDQLSSISSVSLGATIEGQINTLFDSLITDGFIHATDTDGSQDLLQAFYFFDLGSAGATKLNALRPTDTDGDFRLTFAGGWTYNSTGAAPNGTNAYANTHWNPSTNASSTGLGFGVYSRTNSKSGTQVYGAFHNISGLFTQHNFSNENMFSGGIGAIITYSQATTQRYFHHTCRAGNDSESYKDGSSIGTNTVNAAGAGPNLDFYFGARNTDVGPGLYSGHELGVATLENYGFSDAEIATLTTHINTYAAARGWNV
jgi:hypothetical protein